MAVLRILSDWPRPAKPLRAWFCCWIHKDGWGSAEVLVLGVSSSNAKSAPQVHSYWAERETAAMTAANSRVVDLAYGESGLSVELPAKRLRVIAPAHRHPAGNGRAAVQRALSEPV